MSIQAGARQKLSASTSGKQIKVAATATPGTLLHTAVDSGNDRDIVTLFASNTDSVDRVLTIQFGGVASPDDHIEVTLPSDSGLVLVVPGLPVAGGVAVRAFAAAANVVLVTGYVERVVAT
jgi:hypothetical protein